jgi:SAM-dependent MidA family methyltransferase
MSNMRQIMVKEVSQHGVITFARFMELALYCPNFGYYERQDVSPGRGGDFYTSVSVGSLFGELLASQFAQWLEIMAGNQYQLVEAGAHDGRLAGDILGWLQRYRPALMPSLEYWILEPSASRQASQRKSLSDFGQQVRWFDSWESLPPAGVHGIIFSNELLDAMPVHRLGWDAVHQCWFEWGVALEDGEFVWARMTVPPEAWGSEPLLDVPRELLAVLPDGFTTEVGPAAKKWWQAAARSLHKGKLVAIDYGLSSEDFFTPARQQGTLRAYHRHHLSGDLLAHVGDQDLTAHVNFSSIQQAGESEGLKTDSAMTQTQFLTHILKLAMQTNEPFSTLTPAQVRQFQTLTHPEHLGRSFRVLVQSR